MKYLKKYEKIVNPELIKVLEKFFEEFEDHKKSKYYNYSVEKSRLYNIPKIFIEDFVLLQFLYGGTHNNWKYYLDKAEIDYIKKEVKKYVLQSVLKKIEDDYSNFIDLKKVFDERPKWGNFGYSGYISDASVKYSFFLFYDAVKKSYKNVDKYNI